MTTKWAIYGPQTNQLSGRIFTHNLGNSPIDKLILFYSHNSLFLVPEILQLVPVSGISFWSVYHGHYFLMQCIEYCRCLCWWRHQGRVLYHTCGLVSAICSFKFCLSSQDLLPSVITCYLVSFVFLSYPSYSQLLNTLHLLLKLKLRPQLNLDLKVHARINLGCKCGFKLGFRLVGWYPW